MAAAEHDAGQPAQAETLTTPVSLVPGAGGYMCQEAGPDGCPCGMSEQAGWDALADKIVKECARVRPGEVVQIGGGVHAFPLMEALALAVRRAGAFPEVNATSHQLLIRTVAETPLPYLRQVPRHRLRWLEDIDVVIATDSLLDLDAAGVISQERQQALAESQQPLHDAMWERGIRSVYVPFGSEVIAAKCGLTCAGLRERLQAALSVDYEEMAARGRALRQSLEGARRLRVTAPNGTEFTAELARGTVHVEDGVLGCERVEEGRLLAELPSGIVTVMPVDGSVEGRAVIPLAQREEARILDLSLRFDGGRVAEARARVGLKDYRRAMAAAGKEADRVAHIGFGFNPAVQGTTGWSLLDSRADGAAVVILGDNRPAGSGHGSMLLWPLVIPAASLWLDDRLVLQEGRWLVPTLP